jgi:hypothetical protein
MVEKPTLGDARHPLNGALIPRSLVLLDVASLLALAAFVIVDCGMWIAE